MHAALGKKEDEERKEEMDEEEDTACAIKPLRFVGLLVLVLESLPLLPDRDLKIHVTKYTLFHTALHSMY